MERENARGYVCDTLSAIRYMSTSNAEWIKYDGKKRRYVKEMERDAAQRENTCGYGVATISRLLKFIGFFCRISSLL